MVKPILSPLAQFLIKQGFKKNKGVYQGKTVKAPYLGKDVTEAERRGKKFTPDMEKRMDLMITTYTR